MPDRELQARNRELSAALAAAGPAARKALVEDLVLTNMEVARSLARRYGGRSRFAPDLEQVACVALVQAARDFDPSRGHEFLSYAVPSMTGALKRFFRDSAWTIRPPRVVQERHSRLRGLGDHVVDGVSVETYFNPRSLDACLTGGGPPLSAVLPGDTHRSFEQVEARLTLQPHLRMMPEQTREIFRQRFIEGRTQQQIADDLEIPQSRVSRVLTRSLKELRRVITEPA